MSKVYNSAVVIIPPQEKWDSIQEIRETYDRGFNRWMPHITLLYPFRPKTEYMNLEKEFSEICRNLKPFEINFKYFKFFSHGHQNFTLWLDPEPADLIINLQTEILKLVPDCNDVNKFKKGFKPHLSVGQIKGKQNLTDSISKLQKNWIELTFLLDKIYFISRENIKTAQFEIAKQIQFNTE
ncbi:MAG: 2'-5' RNA ligase family protein [Candidatus Lokiarchaeota archaeon]|nr:2'-5' RNA ligase family protein [Candidatus Lokiarchaeota archaeon]